MNEKPVEDIERLIKSNLFDHFIDPDFPPIKYSLSSSPHPRIEYVWRRPE